ncbi:hypothetical protein [Wolbachia endosymbiont (group A) of Ennomos erosarius]|uniref:hypothetical protein n=1 Tax=Wolbachia endosymbiont (group A) of Ennomos erosarius TaxID=3066174 RepID=UPI00333F0B65
MIKHGADRSLIKDEGLIIDRLNSMYGQLPEAVPSTSSHSKINNVTKAQGEEVKKLRVKSKELRAQLKGENESLKQKIKSLENENTKLKDKLDKTESQHSKTEVLLEKAQKELGSVDIQHS